MRPIDADSLMSALNPQNLANRGFRFAGVRSGRTIELAKLLLIKLLEDTPELKNVILMPCNIGDTIYEAFFTKDGTGSHICEYTCSGIHIADKVTRWKSEKLVRYFVLKTAEGHSIHVRIEKLGKALFLTREEAEAALRKGRKDHEENPNAL